MRDQVIKIDGSVIQHGPFNDRVYLMKLAPDNPQHMVSVIEDIAHDNGYSKIFSKIPASAKELFLNNGHIEEATIPGFFNGCENGSFMAKYLSEQRHIEANPGKRKEVLRIALSKSDTPGRTELSSEEECILCTEKDAAEMADLYRQVFPSYPFPIYDPVYLISTMSEDFVYFSIKKKGKIVALSSCEMDPGNSNVEMTDFATLPEARGRGYSYRLLEEMGKEMKNRGIRTAYTIARSGSYGMNTAFSRYSYTYAGTLLNNTNISGGIESMNVWYKKL
ncbi:putative beta-lysine N-acetyltransferase [Methanolobus sp. WCC5]|uniref:putative beta-lysine N-acetyltransferase n=1 Tax=Methanolobus sp. WCC5 TaxID=3125785 RepID=UPI003255E3D8